jgi:hypothetical protein
VFVDVKLATNGSDIRSAGDLVDLLMLMLALTDR